MTDPIRAALERLQEYASAHPEHDTDRLLAEARAALAAAPPAPDPHEALAARPLLEAVARMGDRIGQHTVSEITVISDRAAHWLAQNPPGQPVAIEPRGCPTPGACSCVEPPTPTEPDTDAVLTLAAIIRQAAGNGLPGPARLAELILSHPDAASVFQPPAPAPDPSDFQAFQGIALDMVESLRPIVIPEILGVLRKAIKSTGQPAPATDGEREELAADLRECAASCVLAEKHNWANHMRRAAALLRQSAPAPVPVAERPWEREGWCDAEGRCWLLATEDEYPQWRLHSVEGHQPGGSMIWVPVDSTTGAMVDTFYASHCLPHWAIPQPPQGGEVAP